MPDQLSQTYPPPLPNVGAAFRVTLDPVDSGGGLCSARVQLDWQMGLHLGISFSTIALSVLDLIRQLIAYFVALI